MAKADRQFEPDKNYLIALSKTIRILRENKKLTQEQLADLSGISWMSVQQIEAGPRNIGFGMFVCLAKGLDMEPDELMRLVMKNKENG
jgi:transcriptional regulator with XRE-family HTH domain